MVNEFQKLYIKGGGGSQKRFSNFAFWHGGSIPEGSTFRLPVDITILATTFLFRIAARVSSTLLNTPSPIDGTRGTALVPHPTWQRLPMHLLIWTMHLGGRQFLEQFEESELSQHP